MDDSFFASAEKLEMHRKLNTRELELSEELVRSIERLGSLLTQTDDHYRLALAQSRTLREFFREINLFIEDFESQIFEASRKMNEILTKAGDDLHFYTGIYEK